MSGVLPPNLVKSRNHEIGRSRLRDLTRSCAKTSEKARLTIMPNIHKTHPVSRLHRDGISNTQSVTDDYKHQIKKDKYFFIKCQRRFRKSNEWALLGADGSTWCFGIVYFLPCQSRVVSSGPYVRVLTRHCMTLEMA